MFRFAVMQVTQVEIGTVYHLFLFGAEYGVKNNWITSMLCIKNMNLVVVHGTD